MKRRRSSGRRFAYFQFSSRDVGKPLAVSAAIAVRRRGAAAPASGSARKAVAWSSTVGAGSGVLFGNSRRFARDPVGAGSGRASGGGRGEISGGAGLFKKK